jgi:SAM-dependent methyltransferase
MEPRAALSAMLSGHLVALAISLATRLGIPDLVVRGPRRVSALARATRSHPDTLYRLLRALAAVGVFAERRGRRFARTPLSDLLRAGVRGSLRAPALLAGESWRRVAYDLPAAVRSGRSPFPRAHGDDFYAYLARHPARYRLFLDAMEYHWPELARAVVRAGRLMRARCVVDVGGGPAALMQVILETNPVATGVVLEAPAAAARARRSLVAAGLGRRCRVVAGDFFRSVPRGGDAYVLAFVLHNWDDRRVARILARCRAALGAGARLLVVEALVPADGRPAVAQVHDLEMLVFTDGRERTAAEYSALLEASGFRLHRITAVAGGASVLEALPKRGPSRRRAPSRS